MRKCVIVLDGFSEAKTKLSELAKKPRDGYPNGIWVWQVNSKNVLSVSSRSMGWDGEKNDKYYEYLNELSALVNKYWNFKQNYFNEMITKLKNHEKAQVLIIHDAGEVAKTLKENEGEQEVFFVNLVRDQKQITDNYDKTIVFDNNFEEEVYKLFDVLLEEKEKE